MDIDLMCEGLRTDDARFDLMTDGSVGQSDLSLLIEQIIETIFAMLIWTEPFILATWFRCSLWVNTKTTRRATRPGPTATGIVMGTLPQVIWPQRFGRRGGFATR